MSVSPPPEKSRPLPGDVTDVEFDREVSFHFADAGALALSAGRLGTWRWDLASGSVFWDDALHQVFGISPGEAPGTRQDYLAMVHPEDRAAIASLSVTPDGGPKQVEHRLVLPDGSFRWVAVSSLPELSPDGTPVAMVGVTVDITDRKLAEERLEFLSRAGQLLGSSLDLDTTLQQVCDLAIERLADWCSIDMFDHGDVRLAALAHRDPAKMSYARRLRERFPVDLTNDQGLARVLRSGEPEITPDIDEPLIRAALSEIPDFSPLDIEEFVALGLRSSLVVPLRTAAGRIIGGLTLVAEANRRKYDDDDVRLALEVGGRAAVAVENAQLYQRIERSARTLQRSLLPAELPATGIVDIAAQYHPLFDPDMVGGDFYDVFETMGGRWCVVIGDVAGKGVEAAALTAAVRWTARAALNRDLSPAETMRQLNDSLIRQDWGERFVSIFVGVLEPAGSGVAVHFACGGHPPPVLHRPFGETEFLISDGDLVGLFAKSRWLAHSTWLGPGESLVLYTDGFTDTKSDDVWFDDFGMLSAVKTAPSNASAALLAAHISAVVKESGEQRDDRALLVLTAPT